MVLLKLPNLITPNDDGYNEQFDISALGSKNRLIILNRWGKLVYQDEEYYNDWSADDVGAGIYFYQAGNNCLDGNIKGTVTVVK